MIHAITRQLGVALRDIGCPFPVKYGPLEAEPIPARGGGLIVVQRQGEPESIGTLPSQRQNPKGAGRKRNQGFLVRIFAQSPKAGARVEDHEDLCDVAVDRVIIALEDIVKVRCNTMEWGAAGYVPAADRVTEDRARGPYAGVVYELRGSIDRAVLRRDWPSNADAEGAIAEQVVVGTDVTITTDEEILNDG